MMTRSAEQQPPQQRSIRAAFNCFKCGQEIKLKREADNSGWIRLNLDIVTTHSCYSSKKEEYKTNGRKLPL